MADNVDFQSSTLATPAANTKISTDEDATNGHVQRMKLAISADGSSTHIPADATNGLDVDVTRVQGTVTVDGSGVTQPVSGTVTANLSATDNAVLDSIDTAVNGTLTVDGSGVTQPVSASSLPLPAGAATAANQSTANGSLSTIAGAVSGTEMQVDIVSGNVTNAGTFAVQLDGAGTQSTDNTTTTPLGGGATYTGTGEQNDYQYVMVSCIADQAGTLLFDFSPDGTNWNTFPTAGFSVAANTHEIHTAFKGSRYFRARYTNGATPQSTFRLYTYYSNTKDELNAPLNTDVSQDADATITKAVLIAQAGGAGNFANVQSTSQGNLKVAIEEISDGLDIGAGNAGTETQRVSIATDDVNLSAIKTAVETLDNIVSGSEAQVDVVAALPAGDNNIGNVDIASAIPTGTNTIGAVNVKPTTSGGLAIFRSLDVDETEEEIKSSGGQLYGWYLFNAAASTRYVKFYNATAASVIVGTTTPVLTIPVPAGSAANVEYTNGIAFDTAITVAATTGVADADTGAPSANDVVVNIFYS